MELTFGKTTNEHAHRCTWAQRARSRAQLCPAWKTTLPGGPLQKAADFPETMAGAGEVV
jgi:hypothetical protein